MIAQAANVMNFLKGPKQFIIPVFQRTYCNAYWEQFHDPKNPRRIGTGGTAETGVAAGLSIESTELQEIFPWKSRAEIKELLESKDGNKNIKEEPALFDTGVDS